METANPKDVTTKENCLRTNSKRCFTIVLILWAAIVSMLVVYLVGYLKGNVDAKKEDNLYKPLKHTPEVLRSQGSQKAAGCTESPMCSEVAKYILKKNGSAIDATIAAMFCNGFINQHNMGIGGGFFMTVYIKQERRAYAVNAREKAPMKAKKNMFKGNPEGSRHGPLSVAIPGEVKGLWAVHRRWGRLPWRVLLEPTQQICRDGYTMNNLMRGGLEAAPWVKDDPYLRQQFYNSKNNRFYEPGDHIKPNQVLCNTLKRIAKNGGDDLYSGELANDFAADLAEAKTIITKEDLKKYDVKIKDALKFPLDNGDVLYTTPPPSSGVVLINILNILRGYNLSKDSVDTLEGMVTTYHRIVEAFKYGYVTRSKLGDPVFLGANLTNLVKEVSDPKYGDEIRRRIDDSKTSNDSAHYKVEYYAPNDGGTAHISIIDNLGDAVSVTSSINFYYGSGFTLKRTGIILSNVMDDFSSPGFANQFALQPSPSNYIEPGKRPMSSLTPSIIVDEEGTVKLAVGATGGPKTIATVALIIIRKLWLGYTVKEAILEPLVYHQMFPMVMEYEEGFYVDVLDGLKAKGHGVNMSQNGRWSLICAVPT